MSVPGNIKTSSEIRARADAGHAKSCAGDREKLAAFAEGDRHGIWQRNGCKDMAQWVSGRYGVSRWLAARWVDAAHALERLPMLSEAFAKGVLGIERVVELARFATPETEAELIQWALRVNPQTIRTRADRANAPTVTDHKEAHDSRYLEFWRDELMMRFEGALPLDDGARLMKAVDRIADSLPQAPEGSEVNATIDARRADALVALASTRLAEDNDPDRATLVVHVDVADLEGRGAQGAELEDGSVLGRAVVDRLGCSGDIEWVLERGDRHAVGIGKKSRRVPASLMRQLRYRDRGCTFPGCGTRRFTDAHHIGPWPSRTDLDNLTLVCQFHHKLVHEHEWRVALTATGRAEWFRPDGSRYQPGVRAPPVPAVL